MKKKVREKERERGLIKKNEVKRTGGGKRYVERWKTGLCGEVERWRGGEVERL